MPNNFDSRSSAGIGYDVRPEISPKLAKYLLGAKTIGNFVREHPAASAAIPASFLLPGSTLGVLAGAGIGAGATVIDKAHPLTDQPSDWEAMTPARNMEDMLGSVAYPMAATSVAPATRLAARALGRGTVPAATRAAVAESQINSKLAALREATFGGNSARGLRIPIAESASDASSFAPVGPFIVPKDIPVRTVVEHAPDPFLRPLESAYVTNPLAARVRVYHESDPLERLVPGILPERVPASQIRPTGDLQEVPEMFIGRGPQMFFKRPKTSPGGKFTMQAWDWKAPTGVPGVKYADDATHPAFLR